MGNAVSGAVQGSRLENRDAKEDGGVRITGSIDTSSASSVTIPLSKAETGDWRIEKMIERPKTETEKAHHIGKSASGVGSDSEDGGVSLSHSAQPVNTVTSANDRLTMPPPGPRAESDNALETRDWYVTETPLAEVDASQSLRIADLQEPERRKMVEFMADVEAFVADTADREEDNWPGFASRMAIHLSAAQDARSTAERRGSLIRAAGRVRRKGGSKKQSGNGIVKVNRYGHTVLKAH